MSDFPERRRRPRVPVTGPLPARARATVDVRVLDLSLEGARLQHGGLLRPGAPCLLELPPPVCPLPLRARVVRSKVVGVERDAAGERHLRYESALAFTNLHPDQETALTRALERLASGEGVGGMLKMS